MHPSRRRTLPSTQAFSISICARHVASAPFLARRNIDP